jgi:hypothetical protein
LPLFLSVSNTHVWLTISSINSSLWSFNSYTILGNSDCGWWVLKFLSFVGGGF